MPAGDGHFAVMRLPPHRMLAMKTAASTAFSADRKDSAWDHTLWENNSPKPLPERQPFIATYKAAWFQDSAVAPVAARHAPRRLSHWRVLLEFGNWVAGCDDRSIR
jgi:hypothetical protein